MPKLKSSKKRLLQNHNARARNRSAMSALRSSIKAVRGAADQSAGQEALPRAYRLIDKTVKKGILRRNTGSRYKSRLAKFVSRMD